MKGLVLADLLTVRKYVFQMVFVGAIVGLVIAWGMESVSAMLTCVTASFAYGLGFTLLALDEHKGWDGFRAAFPFTRAQAVVARFLSLLAIVAIGLVLSFAVLALALAASQAVPDLAPIARGGLTATELAVAAALSAAIPLVLFCLTVPFAMRWGATGAVRLMGMVVVVVLLALYVVVVRAGVWIDPLVCFAVSDPIAAVALLLAGVLAAYAASAAITCGLYRNREF